MLKPKPYMFERTIEGKRKAWCSLGAVVVGVALWTGIIWLVKWIIFG